MFSLGQLPMSDFPPQLAKLSHSLTPLQAHLVNGFQWFVLADVAAAIGALIWLYCRFENLHKEQ